MDNTVPFPPKSKAPKPGKQEFTVAGACFECLHLGWFPANEESEIQRCDICKVFQTDADAHSYALELAIGALKKHRRRSGKRFHCVIEALEIAAWEKLGKPNSMENIIPIST